MFKKKTAALILAALMGMSLFAGCKGESQIDPNVEAPILNFQAPEIGEKIAVIKVKDLGEIKIKLFPEDAQKGVENFIGLAEMDYYNEIIFHRVIPNFMNQTGDPRGDGYGGKSIWGDKFDGGVPEGLYHFTGAVAYANSGAPDSNGSQFYIVNTPAEFVYYGGYKDFDELSSATGKVYSDELKNAYIEKGGVPFLDGGYTVFGQVFEGMDIVYSIANVETDPSNDKPLTQVLMESIEIVEYQG